jgi:GAF domain-containing protein
VVDRTRRIGCGACEYKCLVNGEVAIRVYAPGRESVLKAEKNHRQDLQDFFRIYKIFFQESYTSFFYSSFPRVNSGNPVWKRSKIQLVAFWMPAIHSGMTEIINNLIISPGYKYSTNPHMETDNRPRSAAYLLSALTILRESAAEINRLSAENTAADALRLIADTALRLVDRGEGDEPSTVIYAYSTDHAAFDPASRTSTGEGGEPVVSDFPRPDGMGARAIRYRKRFLSYEEPSLPMQENKIRTGIRTMACYPLMAAEKPTGALYIALRSERHFTREELLSLDLLADQAAVALHNTQRFEVINLALQRKVDELERLHGAEQLISSRSSLEQTLRGILRTAVELTRASHGSFRLIDKRAGTLRLAALSGVETLPAEPDLPVDDASSVVGWAAKRRQPVRIDDLRAEPWNKIYRPLHSKGRMLSELATPLLGAGGTLEGVINLESERVGAFSEDDQRLMEALATQGVIALQEARLLEALEEVTARMVSWPLDKLLEFIIQQACDLINAPHGVVWVLSSADPETLVVRAATAGHTPGETLPMAGSLIGSSLRERRPLISPDVSRDPRFLRRELAHAMGWVSGLIVPLLMRDGTPRGALTLYSAEPRSFSEWDQRLLTWLANHTAIAVQDAETLDQLAQAREKQTLAETFAALGDVSANLLHRVNNLVGIIPVRIQGVREKRPALDEDPYLSAALTEIEGNARTAMAAAREAMAYLRPVKLQPTSVEICFRTALDRLALPDGILVVAEGLESLPPVMAGEEQLRLVFFNLMENAADALTGMDGAAGRPGLIRVSGRAAADPPGRASASVEILLSDNGPGIPTDRRENVFDLAFSTKRSPRKLGFGLWWVKTLITRLGGEIRVVDCNEGCAFLIRLPSGALPGGLPPAPSDAS